MQVEIYDERELNPATLKPEQDAEALAIIRELGLSGQTTEDGETRISYPKPTADQAFVIGVLFPKRSLVTKYDAGSIPLRVLKEMRNYIAENPKDVLFIAHQAPAIVSDPVLLAYTGRADYLDYTELASCRLVARWGDALGPWADLLKIAMERHRVAVRDALSRCVAQAKALIAEIDEGCTLPTPRRTGDLPALSGLPRDL